MYIYSFHRIVLCTYQYSLTTYKENLLRLDIDNLHTINGLKIVFIKHFERQKSYLQLVQVHRK